MKILSPQDQKKVLFVTVFQVCMGGLDLIGVAAIGLVGALSVSGVQSQEPNERLSSVLNVLHISDFTFQTQVTILGIGAVLLLVSRTFLSVFSTRRVLFFLSRRGAQISSTLVSRLLSQSLLKVQAKTSQESLYAVTSGVELIVMQILATGVVLVSDISLLLILGIGLTILDPVTAFGTFLLFLVVSIFMYRFMQIRARGLGVKHSQLSIASNEKIVEVLGTFRESVVRNRRDYYAREIGRIRFSLAETTSEMNFMPYVSKYFIETTVIVSALLISAAQFFLQDVEHAVATLAIFIAAGTRIAPAILRVQQGLIMIQGSIGKASPTLELIQALGEADLIESVDDFVDTSHEGFNSEVQLRDIYFSYPNNPTPTADGITFTIPSGSFVAFTGPSGAGKTTVIDLLLGVLEPDKGSVLISGLSPLSAVVRWPGAISYVPQDVTIVSGTIRENIALGFPAEAATEELVMSALKIAHLDKFVAELPQGLDTQVGERGTKLSGGQRQRLGLARAMFTRPLLLVLDEATSSLDGETESIISEAIYSLHGSITVLMIAHRLSTVRNADIVIYISSGKVQAQGTFEEVRTAIPDFDNQARLMGL